MSKLKINTIKGKDLERLKVIHQKILLLAGEITSREFPIYIRYLKGDEIFALLYFHTDKSFEIGFNIDNNLGFLGDASWMNYGNIKYSVIVKEGEDLDKIFNKIKKYFNKE